MPGEVIMKKFRGETDEQRAQRIDQEIRRGVRPKVNKARRKSTSGGSSKVSPSSPVASPTKVEEKKTLGRQKNTYTKQKRDAYARTYEKEFKRLYISKFGMPTQYFSEETDQIK